MIERLAGDLQQPFPGHFSRSNIWRMRSFFLAYREEALREADSRTFQPSDSKSLNTSSTPILAQPVRELDLSAPPAALTVLPWGHNILLIERLKGREHRMMPNHLRTTLPSPKELETRLVDLSIN